MCSTSYGGSSELTNMWSKNEATSRIGKLSKHTFDIQGDTDLLKGVQVELDRLALCADTQPNLVLFVEIPTNPDMKVPDMGDLAALCTWHKIRTGKSVVLVVDTTFAPGSRVMDQLKIHAEDLPVLCFMSMSKSVSRGTTTAGALIANHTAEAQTILRGASDACKLLDVGAKSDQLRRLVDNYDGVVARTQKAYEVARIVSEKFQKSVCAATGESVPLAFVSPDQAALGFTAATFSFNLPKPQNATAEDLELLAQRFVDLLCRHQEFKPCVSFGHDNGLVYVTVPATSTQGAIKAEDKAKQAVGGVQLVRLSFPPTCDVEGISAILDGAVSAIYNDALFTAHNQHVD